jgi:type IV pilus assembly protein PilM
MFGMGKPKSLVGLDIGSSAVKAMELKKRGGAYELVSCGLEYLGRDTVVDGAIMDALSVSGAIQRIFVENRINTRHLASSVSGHAVIVKRITVNTEDKAELDLAIHDEAPQHIPFDISDVNLSYQLLGESLSGVGTDAMLVAVKREKILNHTNTLIQADKTPWVVDYDGFAMFNAFEANYEAPAGAIVALLNIGASITNIVVGRGGTPLFARDVSVGGNQYTDTLEKELNLSYEDAEKLKQGLAMGGITTAQQLPHLRSVSEILMIEIQKTFDFFRQTPSAENVQHIYLAGGSAKIEGLMEQLKEEFHVPVEIIDPFRKVRVDAAKFDAIHLRDIAPQMCVAMGLALRSFD